jgi:anti-sigma regulatory factor (Ser/Thr protein kinase)
MEKRLLVSRWLGSDTQPIPIYDEASVSTARQRVRDVGDSFGASKNLIESAALIASELTHNQLAYARHGYFTVRAIDREGKKGLEIVAADLGPGLQRPLFTPQASAPPSKTLGAGLEGVFRIADEVDFDSRVDEGVCVVARKFAGVAGSWEIAIAGRPLPGEVISGDDGAFFHSENNLLTIVADGLGHGIEAREASNRAMEVVARSPQADLDGLASALNTELAGTRGCALSVVRLDGSNGDVECLAAGDVHAHLYSGRDAHFFTSTPFVVGDAQFARRRLRTEHTTIDAGSILLMFTDGVHSRTTLKGELELLRRPAIAIAQHLLATHARPNDDAMVLVARRKK